MSSATSTSSAPASASAPIDTPVKETKAKATKKAAGVTKADASKPTWKEIIKALATGGRAGAWRVALKKFAEDLLDATPARVSQLNHAIASLVEDRSLCLREACLAPKTPRDNEPASKTKPASKAKPAAKATGVKAKATVPAKKPTSKPKAAATKAKKARSLVLAVVGKKAAPATKVTAKKPRSALKPRSPPPDPIPPPPRPTFPARARTSPIHSRPSHKDFTFTRTRTQLYLDSLDSSCKRTDRTS
ncbi:hypothetical protein K438DRAFT_1778455 [Mycena galopus ATCC 62051]|nr:hypothetical protein K438DRAFT_1778455 [Mycena galopus ATCC 62051]